MILQGDVKGGEFIEEKELSEAVGVSRTPVREAFHRLQSDHFISLVPHRGAVVRQITAQELSELYEARRLIESHAVRRICEEKKPIPGILRQLETAIVETSGSQEFLRRAEMDQALHRNIVALIDNNVMVELYDQLQVRQQRVAIAAMQARPERSKTIDAEHRQLIEALEQHDADRAVKVISAHLRPVFDVISSLPV
ncbi:transcriptional regulator, GntR family [Tranquillimonas alkanivorans]|uniref:Transcriptional regulator, GntR family n=2 Tax=Tranquillimonas alkanivorans TaxID=441119 RepID=A0A1I5TLK3_9RHOB|nr:transcriptional regulator, GntR family [Tranquillimonas alkanivorans]